MEVQAPRTQTSTLAEDLDLFMEICPTEPLAQLRAELVASPPAQWAAPAELCPLRSDLFTRAQLQEFARAHRRRSTRATFADVYAD